MIGVIALAIITWVFVSLMQKSQYGLASNLVTAPIGRARIITLTVVTAGLYIFYWLYITWKQLRDNLHPANKVGDTADPSQTFFPVWHALTMLVPVYNMFRLHRHVELVRDMAVESGIETSLNPKLVVLLILLNTILGLTSSGVHSVPYLFILNAISLALITTSILWTQATLNEYWSKTSEGDDREMPIQLGEKAFTLIGIVLWGSVIGGLFFN
jgi:hypothetical protein